MRGLAALAVVAFHAFLNHARATGAMAEGPVADTATLGWIGVDFFFVLSAFLLTLPFLSPKNATGPRDWSRFVAKRWIRIAPPYLLALGLALLVVAPRQIVDDPLDVLAHGLFLHSFSPDWVGSINPVFWTLALEFQFYLILPFLATLLLRRRWMWSVPALVLGSLLYRLAVYDGSDQVRTFWLALQLPAFMGHFALGALAARAYHDVASSRVPRSLGITLGVLLLAVPLVFLYGQDYNHVYMAGSMDAFLVHVFARPMLGLGFAVLLPFLLHPENTLAWRAFMARPVAWLGKTSYSLYLAHVPIMVLLPVWIPVLSKVSFSAALPLYVLASIAIGGVFHYAIEAPSLRLKDALFGRTDVVKPKPVIAVVRADA